MALFAGSLYAESLGMNTGVTVSLPGERRDRTGDMPVLYLLHGLSDDHTSWVRRTDIDRYAEEWGVAVIMPEVQRSFYCDMTNGPLIVIFSLIIAVVLNKKMIAQGFFRTVFFLPFLLGTGYVMKQLLGVGAVDQAMTMARSIVLPAEVSGYLGADLTGLLTAFLSQITWVFWRSGVQVILFLAGLQSINKSLYESARVDSATEWEVFWKITIPMITPMMLLIIVYTIIDSFTDPTNPIGEMFMHRAFDKTEYSLSAAMSWVYFLFIILLVGIVFLVMKRFIHSEFDK